MNKHTPGPWTVRGPTQYLNQTQIDPSIGCVYGNGDEVAANAALVAAAPEMLDALRKAVVLLAGACVHYPDLEPHETYEAVSAAIAKATGAVSP